MNSARYFYRRCQELCIPTVTLTRWAAYGCPITNDVFDDCCKTAHMVATNTRRVSMCTINQLWTKVNLPESDPRREKLPARCDRRWFCRTFLGMEDTNRSSSNSIWPMLTRLHMYDPLSMMVCVSAYRETYFHWESKVVNGVRHKYCGVSETNTGVIDATALRDKLGSLLQLSLRSALQNIS
uniref:Uncharacterized protein n=1 Tax=Trieres chinensis TaxID=1514140 RepID=A0A7S2EP73_TRICV